MSLIARVNDGGIADPDNPPIAIPKAPGSKSAGIDPDVLVSGTNHLSAVLMHTPPDSGFIELRAIPRKGSRRKPQVLWLPTNAQADEISNAVKWADKCNKDGADLYLGYNPRAEKGDGTQEGVTTRTASFVDLDLDKFGIKKADALAAIDRAPIKPNLVVNSGHGLHLIHFHEPVTDSSTWSMIQDRIANQYQEVGADIGGFKQHEAAILRLTPFTNMKDGSKTGIVSFQPEETPRPFSDFVKGFTADRRVAPREEKKKKTEAGLKATDGIERIDEVVDMNRNVTLTKEAGRLRKYGYSEDEILATLIVLNANRCSPPLPLDEVEHIAESVSRYRPDEDIVVIDEATEKSIDVNFGVFRTTEFPNVEPVIFGLRPAQIGMVQAVPNVGKTTMMLNLAASVAVGRSYDLLYEGGRPRKVMYLDFENTASFLQMDIVRMAESLDEDEQRLLDENLIVVVDKFLGEDPLDLAIEAHSEAVLRRAVDRGVELIVVDTMAEAFSLTNENDNSEMKRVVISPLKKLANKTNACVLLVHHIGKLNEGKANDSLYRGRGASSLAAAARLIINMDHLRDGDNAVVKEHVRVHCAKVKGPSFDDRVFRLNFAERWFEATDIQIAGPDAKQDQIIALVDTQLKRAEIIARAMANGFEESQTRSIERAVQFGVSTGYLRKCGHGRWEPTALWVKKFGDVDTNPMIAEAEPIVAGEGELDQLDSPAEGTITLVESIPADDAQIAEWVETMVQQEPVVEEKAIPGANVVDIKTRKARQPRRGRAKAATAQYEEV